MDYDKIYDRIILRSRTRKLSGYCEKHHIIPRCVGGNDDLTNIANLTPEEHYFAHQLLIKMTRYKEHENYNGLVFGAYKMTKSNKYVIRSNKLYGWLKRRFSIVNSIKSSKQFTDTRWITNDILDLRVKDDVLPAGFRYGRGSKSLKQKVGDFNRGKIESVETKRKKSLAHSGRPSNRLGTGKKETQTT